MNDTTRDVPPARGEDAAVNAEAESGAVAGTGGLEVAPISEQRPHQAISTSENSVLMSSPRGHRMRFTIIYVVLGVALAGSVAALIDGFVVNKVIPTPPWSTWAPPAGSVSSVTSAIATHVADEYRLNTAGAELVGVEPEALTYTSGTHKLAISTVAVRRTPTSNTGIVFYPTTGAYADLLCGLGASCSISSGKASVTRGRLVRREALELALYTFKFAPAVNSLVAYMPPPPGSTSTTLLYFQKADLAKQLSQPLDTTLPLKQPPLPSSSDTTEASMIDKLTLPDVYSYSLTALQDGSLALVLAPITS